MKNNQTTDYPKTLKNLKTSKNYKWGSFLPLVGGESFGCAIATKSKPNFILTYNGFQENEKHLTNYWPDVPYINLDEYTDGVPDNLRKLYFENVDFINAVPPCAGLSQLNTCKSDDSVKARGADAIQNNWLYKTSEFVLEHIKPKVLWGENAPGLFTKIGEDVVEKLKSIANKYNYSFSLMKTNSLLHGVPQRRERTYYFFWQSEYAPIMNYNVVDECISLDNYFNQLPKGLEHEDEYAFINDDLHTVFKSYRWLLNKESLTHKEFVDKYAPCTLYQYFIENNLVESAIEFLEKEHPTSKEIKWLKWILTKAEKNMGFWDNSPHLYKEHCNAIVTRNMVCTVHPTEERYYNIREMLWLMGMPWDFNFVRNEKGNYNANHLAQNVPVITSRDQCNEVLKFINNELPSSGQKFLKQNNHKPIKIYTTKSLF